MIWDIFWFILACYYLVLAYIVSIARNLAVSISEMAWSTLKSIYHLFTNVACSVWGTFAQAVISGIGVGDVLLCSLIGSKQPETAKTGLMKVVQPANSNSNHQQVMPLSLSHISSGRNDLRQQSVPNSSMTYAPDYEGLVKTLLDNLLMFLKCAAESLQETRSSIAVSVQTQISMRDLSLEQVVNYVHQTRVPCLQATTKPLPVYRPITRIQQFSMSFQYKYKIGSHKAIDLTNHQAECMATNDRNKLVRIRSARSEPRLSLLGQAYCSSSLITADIPIDPWVVRVGAVPIRQ